MADFLSPSNHQLIPLPQNTTSEEEEDKKPSFQELQASSSSSSRKPRGRPPGSKNKPKPPIIITKEHDSSMRPMLLEIPPNTDVLDSVADFARRRGLGISVLAGSGAVSNVSLRHPTVHTSAINLTGRFEILSLSGTFLSSKAPAAPFAVSVAGAQGQVIGGAVAGPLVAAGTVVVTAAAFLSPEFHRLPVSGGEEDVKEDQDVKQETVYSYAGPSAQEIVLWGTPAASAAATPRAPPPHSHRPPTAHY